ncbi:MAG: site-specific integrase [Pseudomonadota bacterium]
MPQAKSLTISQLEQVLDSIKPTRYSARDRAMILLSFWSGMRVGEIAALKISDVLTLEGTIMDEIRLKPEQTKGKNHRMVMIGLKLCNELNIYISTLDPTDDSKPLFISQKTRKKFNPNALVQKFRRMYESAGIYGATSHSGRRTFITQLANKGISVRVLQSLAGHKSIVTTQLYIDVNDEMKRTAVNMV